MNRHGSIYILVLVTTAFVLATGLAALELERRTHERSLLNGEVAAARIAARSGLDLTLQSMLDDPAWRSKVNGSGVYLTRTIDTGDASFTITATVSDSDGFINNGDDDAFTLTVLAEGSGATRSASLKVQPIKVPVDVLEFGAYAAGQVNTGTSASVNGTAGIGARGDFIGNGSLFFVPVETEGTVDSATYTSTVTENALPREFPPDDAIGALYEPYGTSISMSDLTLSSGAYVIEKRAVGPTRNPFGLLGVLSPDNVYVFDHGSRDIIVRNSRIVGTFVFIGSGNVILEGSLNWAPAVAGWPIIINDDSNLIFRMSSNSLSESALSTNFNPVGLGAGGTEDIDTADFYQSQLTGIVYTRNQATVESGSTRVLGSLVCGSDINVSGSAILDLRVSTDSLTNPPLGFRSVDSPKMVVTEWLDP